MDENDGEWMSRRMIMSQAWEALHGYLTRIYLFKYYKERVRVKFERSSTPLPFLLLVALKTMAKKERSYNPAQEQRISVLSIVLLTCR
jgi:hypothetical protein